ncbi:MAG TPA: SDR family NAD(P)-dependent oxidoreductase [Actinoplanes sp.]|nr:SDR family NAD(P)-dependent oxidoreductase [Actinoplanes sp.]
MVTGSSGGIGAGAAIRLAQAGHRVVITGRSAAKLDDVHRRLRTTAGGGAVPEPIQADFSRLDEVRRLARTVLVREKRIDVLVNNAAVQPRERSLSADGHELGLAVNHLAHQLLTSLLSERLTECQGRVVTTASDEHENGILDFDDMAMERSWSSAASYARSKLANVLFTTEVLRRTGIPASSFHPGSVSTDLNRDVPFVRLIRPFERLVYKSPRRGADTLVWLATSEEGGAPQSPYYVDCVPAPVADRVSAADAARLWDVSSDLIAGRTTDDSLDPA